MGSNRTSGMRHPSSVGQAYGRGEPIRNESSPSIQQLAAGVQVIAWVASSVEPVRSAAKWRFSGNDRRHRTAALKGLVVRSGDVPVPAILDTGRQGVGVCGGGLGRLSRRVLRLE